MADRPADQLRYAAFLSYSHKDAAAAASLHRRLESYRVPRRLVGAATARGPAPARLWPIFRDREELPAATDLTETVRRALAGSGALIVLCSPNAAQSLWVAEEIETFRRYHPDRPILAAILSGGPPDCFPTALKPVDQTGVPHEPLAADLRRGGDGRHLGMIKLVAGITGLELDQLVQRDANRRIRRVTAVTVVALLAMLAMAALTILALGARTEADGQREEAEGLIAFMQTDLQEPLRDVGRLDAMATVNRRALDYYREQEATHGLTRSSILRRARVRHLTGEVAMLRADRPAAAASFGQAYAETARELIAAPNDPDALFSHAQSEYWIGYFAFEHRRFAMARRYFEAYRGLAERLVAVDPRSPNWRREQAYAQGNLCSADIVEQVPARDALRSCGAALRLMERVLRLVPNDRRATIDVANRHAWMADMWNAAGQWSRALDHKRRQEALARSLLEREPENSDTQDFWMRTQFTFGRLLLQHGDRAEARRYLNGAATTAALLRGRDPENVSWRSFQEQIARLTSERRE